MLLSIEDLSVAIRTKRSSAPIIEHLSLGLEEGEVLGLVGESGSGKSMLASAIMGSFPTREALITSGRVVFGGEDLCRVSARRYRQVRGNEIAIILQDSLASLNPILRVSAQVKECIAAHPVDGSPPADGRISEAFRNVSFPLTRSSSYPHQLSGGMRQRVAAAMALVNHPRLLIADEPTTALDVTVQAQFLRLLERLNAEHAMAVILISHDLAVVAQVATSIAVMYAGRLMEHGPAEQILDDPKHPYTRALLQAIPRVERRATRLATIPGFAPPAFRAPTGCAFRTRCQFAMDVCAQRPPLVAVNGVRRVACWLETPEPGEVAVGVPVVRS